MTSPLRPRQLELGALFTEALPTGPIHYGDPATEMASMMNGVGLIDLTHLSAFLLQCSEARRWGNGMFSNNIKRLSSGSGNRNAMCDDRGRVLGLLDLYLDSSEELMVVLDGVDRDWFEAHYRMYLILDDVDLVPDEDEAPRVLSIQGPGAEALVESLGWRLDDEERSHVTREDGVRMCRRGRAGLPGFDVLIPPTKLVEYWNQFAAAGATPVGLEALESLRILKGLPRWPVDSRKITLIHELGIESEVCSFNKGCYVGQEVINRVDVKGTVNKRITGFRVDGDVPPIVGSDVRSDGKSVGTMTSVVRHGDHWIGLGILRKTAWDAGLEIELKADGQSWSGQTVSLPLQ